MKKIILSALLLLSLFSFSCCSINAPEYTINNNSGEAVRFTFGIKTSTPIDMAIAESIAFSSYYQAKLFFINTSTGEFYATETYIASMEDKIITITKKSTES